MPNPEQLQHAEQILRNDPMHGVMEQKVGIPANLRDAITAAAADDAAEIQKRMKMIADAA